MGNLQVKPKQTSENPQEDERESDEREEVDEELAASMSFTCEICYEPMLSNNKFNNTSRCVHPFCKECIAKYIHVKVEGGVADIECPGLKCNQILDPMTCRSILARQVFDKWCDNLCELAVLWFDGRCYCPNRDCSVLVVNECGGVVKREKCPNCKKLFCFKCKIAWHAGYRCEESGQVRDRNDVLFGQLVERKKWARCPRCGQAVERRYGCFYMICSQPNKTRKNVLSYVVPLVSNWEFRTVQEGQFLIQGMGTSSNRVYIRRHIQKLLSLLLR